MKNREIEWLEHISSLNDFTSDSFWSVYNARKDDTEIAPCGNSILPLLRQSVATYCMQKHCIEVGENSIDALNPVLKSIMKYIFAFKHYNYARWLTNHVDDLMKLELVCSNVYKEFCSANFVARKTINPFSATAFNQAHEQNNAIIKGAGGAVGLLSKDMDSALRRWEVAAPEV